MKRYLAGLLFVILIACCAYAGAMWLPLGSVTLAIIIGIIVGNSMKIPSRFDQGITFAEKSLLSFAIALMGINLDFSILLQLGFKTVLLIVLGMAVTIFSALAIGKLFKMDQKLSLLIGVGNGVCGSSAIGASAPIIKAEQSAIALSIAVVNFLGTIGIFLVPGLALFFGFSDVDSGIIVGNTLQAVGQVTAGGFSISHDAGVSATAVKMGRVLLLTPLVFILIYLFRSKTETDTKGAKVPLFILFFIFFSLLSSFGLVSEAVKSMIAAASHLSLIVAMAAVGLRIHLLHIKQHGRNALAAASLVFMVQIIFSFLLLNLFL